MVVSYTTAMKAIPLQYNMNMLGAISFTPLINLCFCAIVVVRSIRSVRDVQ